MWIRVALDMKDVHYGSVPEYTYVEGKNVKEFYFDEYIATELERDGFLQEMWSKLDAKFDWGDCDYFFLEKCKKFKDWLEHRLKAPVSDSLKQVYKSMLDLTNLGIKCGTGVCFDF